MAGLISWQPLDNPGQPVSLEQTAGGKPLAVRDVIRYLLSVIGRSSAFYLQYISQFVNWLNRQKY